MGDVLNPPERVVKNIRSACAIMCRVDAVLRDKRLREFAIGVSRILAHMEPSKAGLCNVVANDARFQVFVQIFNAATELQTAWNTIRLANIPASQRHGRVAFESIGVAVVFALPTSTIANLPQQTPLGQWLQAHPESTAIDAYKPVPRSEDEPERREPPVKATQFFNSFLKLAELELKMPADSLRSMKEYRMSVQHPASHATAELYSFHFETLTTGAAGAVFDPKRSDSYVQAADDLIDIAHLLADILDWVTRYMADSQ
jgi:hypothetical protein